MTTLVTTSSDNTGARDQRILGLAPWKPQAGSKKKRLLDDVLVVLEEWVGTDVVPSLTTRAILYRLLPLGWKKSDEEDLTYVLKRGRRAGLIPFHQIADGRSEEYIPFSWQSPDHFRRQWRVAAEQYRLDRLTDQPNVELWVETAGMVAMLEEVADELGTPI